MTASPIPEETGASLEYTRRLYESVLDWYKNADTKAQVILSLDGIFLTVIAGNALLLDAERFDNLPWYSLALLALMCATLALSLYHSIACIWSRLYSRDELEEFLDRKGVALNNHETYAPVVCWFFQFVSSLDQAEFEKRMRSLEPTFEIDVMSNQVYLLSGNVVRKHQHVNWGFTFAAITFLLFLASGMSLLLS